MLQVPFFHEELNFRPLVLNPALQLFGCVASWKDDYKIKHRTNTKRRCLSFRFLHAGKFATLCYNMALTLLSKTENTGHHL